MKKIIWIIGLAALALGVFGVGVVWAQDVQPPAVPGAGVNGGYGWMHDYIESALADKLGIPETDVESALASGKTMYQIALDNGVAEADIPAFFAEIPPGVHAPNSTAAGIARTSHVAGFMAPSFLLPLRPLAINYDAIAVRRRRRRRRRRIHPVVTPTVIGVHLVEVSGEPRLVPVEPRRPPPQIGRAHV